MTEPRVAVDDVVRIAQMITAGEIDYDEAHELVELLSWNDERPSRRRSAKRPVNCLFWSDGVPDRVVRVFAAVDERFDRLRDLLRVFAPAQDEVAPRCLGQVRTAEFCYLRIDRQGSVRQVVSRFHGVLQAGVPAGMDRHSLQVCCTTRRSVS